MNCKNRNCRTDKQKFYSCNTMILLVCANKSVQTHSPLGNINACPTFLINALLIQEMMRYLTLNLIGALPNWPTALQTISVTEANPLAYDRIQTAISVLFPSVFTVLQVSFCWSSPVWARRRRWQRERRSWRALSLTWSSTLLTCSGWLNSLFVECRTNTFRYKSYQLYSPLCEIAAIMWCNNNKQRHSLTSSQAYKDTRGDFFLKAWPALTQGGVKVWCVKREPQMSFSCSHCGKWGSDVFPHVSAKVINAVEHPSSHNTTEDS